MLRRALSLLIIVALAAAACVGGGSETSSQPSGQQDREPSPTAPADTGPESDSDPGPGSGPAESLVSPPVSDGRLVVQSSEFGLSTMLPDGTEPAPLTDPGTTNYQASWAPDGSRVAWVAIDDATGAITIATDRFDRSDPRSIEVDNAPFYLYWDPSASRIAHLAASEAGIDLSVSEPLAEGGPTTRRVDRGQPYFLAWGPDGDELLVHASGFRLDRIDLESAIIIVEESPAPFGAAAWLTDGTLIYADTDDDQQFLVTAGDFGEGRRPLITFEGSLRFSVSNQGNRLVMQAVALDDDNPIVTASTVPGQANTGVTLATAQPSPTTTPTPGFDDSLDAIDEIVMGIPYLMGTFGGEPFALSTNPAVALFPSPDGQSIAWFESVPTVPSALTVHFDNNGRRQSMPAFIPSAELRNNYFPFFDQYELSHDFWSPTSSLFVYAGRPLGADEADGIWVYDRRTGQQNRIADGVVASFTRTPDAGGLQSAL